MMADGDWAWVVALIDNLGDHGETAFGEFMVEVNAQCEGVSRRRVQRGRQRDRSLGEGHDVEWFPT